MWPRDQYTGPGGGRYTGLRGGLYTGPSGGAYTGPGGGLYTGPGGGLYTGPGGGLYSGPGGGLYAGDRVADFTQVLEVGSILALVGGCTQALLIHHIEVISRLGMCLCNI